jgi:glycine/D-amino acid oxidase-like deaminating enzyme
MVADRPHVLIVGAGIIGASIAWHLVRAGARVTVTDAGEPGGIATRNSWAWINASWGNPEPYFRLRARAMDDR